jgi:hypothetical protein
MNCRMTGLVLNSSSVHSAAMLSIKRTNQLSEYLTMRDGPFTHDERIALAMLGLVVLADVACFAILAALLCGRLPF